MTSKTKITVCTWNIHGKARAADRREVTTATFQERFIRSGIRLKQSDIICVQEMICKPDGGKAQEYLPFAAYPCKQYGASKEPQSANTYNAVFYNKENFAETCILDGYFCKAYIMLMGYKKQCYDYISRDDIRLTDTIQGKLNMWTHSKDERRMCKEVL